MHRLTHGHESNMVGAGGFLAGIVVGSLAGAGTALLLAPESGKRTRADIQTKGIQLRAHTVETLENTMTEARVKARNIAAPVRQHITELQHHGEEILEEQLDRTTVDADFASTEQTRRE
jgi:gas vesicle protein